MVNYILYPCAQEMYGHQFYHAFYFFYQKKHEEIRWLICKTNFLSFLIKDYEMDIYLREEWTDERLAYISAETEYFTTHDPDLLNKLWQPDLFISNARKAYFHTVTVPNLKLWLYPTGLIRVSRRYSLKLSCDMQLWKFPMDTQFCFLDVLSYKYPIELMNVSWYAKESFGKKVEISLPEFYIRDLRPAYCNGTYIYGNYSCLRGIMELQRYLVYHLFQSFIPTGSIVAISWINFWIAVEAVPARVSICITTLLTLTTQSNGARSRLPTVSYVKAIDVWMTACLCFVVSSMLEFTMANYIQNLQKGKNKENKSENLAIFKPVGQNEGKKFPMKEPPKSNEHWSANISPSSVDRASRVLFPVAFLAFNLVFCSDHADFLHVCLLPEENMLAIF